MLWRYTACYGSVLFVMEVYCMLGRCNSLKLYLNFYNRTHRNHARVVRLKRPLVNYPYQHTCSHRYVTFHLLCSGPIDNRYLR